MNLSYNLYVTWYVIWFDYIVKRYVIYALPNETQALEDKRWVQNKSRSHFVTITTDQRVATFFSGVH